MASIVRKKSKTGIRYDIQLSPNEHPDRPKIALGRITKKDASDIKTHIQRLIRHKLGAELSPLTLEWLVEIPESLRNRLESLKLIKPKFKKNDYTVKSWCDAYIQMRKNDQQTKPDTIRKMENVSKRLGIFFKDSLLNDINSFEAKSFRTFLSGTIGLAENTIRKHIAISRQFFNAAIEAQLINNNPFTGKGQPVTVQPNQSRFFFVTPEMAQKVLDACPDAHWRLIFGLARFGGLRCPSEVLRLKWEDIDFENKQFTVHASKTEHHADAGIRIVPIFPELMTLFQDVFDQAKPGTVYCLDRYNGKWTNLGVNMARIIKRAGLKPWPKLFQNCRSTRETELFKLTGGNVKAVCSWIGNSPTVAMQHYAQITEADMKQAAKLSVLNNAEKRVHNRVHTTAEPAEIDRTQSQGKKDSLNVTPLAANSYKEMEMGANSRELHPLGVTGLEPVTPSLSS